MEIHIRMGPGLAQDAGASRLNVTLPSGATVRDLLAHLRESHPEDAVRFSAVLPVVRGSYVTEDHELSAGDEVALLRPVSGGSV